jgi:hypothetical protein
MKMFSRCFFALFCVVPSAVLAETLTDDSILLLVHAGLGDAAIVAKIKNTPGNYDTSIAKIIALKKSGVSDAVMAAMMENAQKDAANANNESADPLTPHAAGVYLLADWANPARMDHIDATTANQTKNTGMLGYAFSGGIAAIKMKSVLPNEAARIKSTSKRPVFFFYFDKANASLSNSGGGFSSLLGLSAVTSPNEFSLVKFDVKEGHREIATGKFSMYGGAKSGVMDKSRIDFTYKDISPGVFKVFMNQDMEPGEYGFIYSSSAGSGIGMYAGGISSSRIFDFTVK